MDNTIHFTLKNRVRKVSYNSLKPIRLAKVNSIIESIQAKDNHA